jgi:hypothetical protein
MLLWCDLIEVVEWVLNRNAPHSAEPHLCTQFAQFCFGQAEGTLSFPMTGNGSTKKSACAETTDLSLLAPHPSQGVSAGCLQDPY